MCHRREGRAGSSPPVIVTGELSPDASTCPRSMPPVALTDRSTGSLVTLRGSSYRLHPTAIISPRLFAAHPLHQPLAFCCPRFVPPIAHTVCSYRTHLIARGSSHRLHIPRASPAPFQHAAVRPTGCTQWLYTPLAPTACFYFTAVYLPTVTTHRLLQPLVFYSPRFVPPVAHTASSNRIRLIARGSHPLSCTHRLHQPHMVASPRFASAG